MINFKKREKKGGTIKIAEDKQLNKSDNIESVEEDIETSDSIASKEFLNKKRGNSISNNFSVRLILN